MSQIYRKAALDRLASPEQLDKQIKITSPMVWISSAGIGLVLAVVIIWGFWGNLPEKVAINGMYTNDAKTQREFISSSGIIEVLVSKDDYVKDGQLLAKIDSSEIDKVIDQIEKDITDIKSITFLSTNDLSTSQTSPLLEIKSKYNSLGFSNEQYEAQLSALYGQLGKQKKEVKDLKYSYDKAETAYLAAVGDDSLAEAELDAQIAEANVTTATNALTQAQTDFTAAETAFVGAGAPALPDAIAVAYYEAETNLLNAQTTLATAQTALATAYVTHEALYRNQGESTEEKQRLFDSKSMASSLFSSSYSMQKSIEGNISNLKIQMGGDEANVKAQEGALEFEFTKTKEAILSELDKELIIQRDSLGYMEVIADDYGIVTELLVENGQIVAAGTALLKMKSDEAIDDMVVCFVPLSEAKKLTWGMDVTVTPSTVTEQEYGHMIGVIAYIGEYYATTLEMSQMFGDDLMVSALQQQGPSLKVIIDLMPDPNTVSGYEWSNKKGADIPLTQGTIIAADVITAQKAPITKLLPYLEGKLDVEIEESD